MQSPPLGVPIAKCKSAIRKMRELELARILLGLILREEPCPNRGLDLVGTEFQGRNVPSAWHALWGQVVGIKEYATDLEIAVSLYLERAIPQNANVKPCRMQKPWAARVRGLPGQVAT